MSQNGKYVMQGIHSLKMTRNLSAAIRKFILRKIMSRNKSCYTTCGAQRYPIKRYDVEKWISGLESKENIQLAEKQRKGIEMVFQNPVSIITGGPGSGKTTLLRFYCYDTGKIEYR